MKEKLIISIMQGMLSALDNKQLDMLRDVLTNSTPFVLVKRIYAIAAIAGSLTYYLMFILNINDNFAIITGTLVTFILRILAMTFKWNMPKAID